ncbi:MAG: NIPSNAP family protein [Verrucomicrobia bacterium]|nr:NIPSNAP family protein [Verrucomicrobiota bacterium]
MKLRPLLLSAFAAVAALATGCATGQHNKSTMAVYELRIYHIAAGKTEDLHNRFRNHTLKLFSKHGIESIGYWMPLDEKDQRLHFLLRYPSREAREASWKAFVSDPAWQAAAKASEVNGRLVEKVENPFLVETDYSPGVRKGNLSKGGVWELRDYTTPSGRLPNLDSRFRDHTIALFAKHGMGNQGYFHLMSDQVGADTRLLYFLTHKSTEAAKASFGAFGADPAWKAAREASEKVAGGSLTMPGGVKSLFLKPTDYSPTK